MAATGTSSPPAGSTARLVDPTALMRIKSLQVRARIIVQGFLSGLHRSPNHGFSVEFSEYRQYSPGDDTRYIDWRLFARSDRYYLKRFEEETNLRCHVLLDLSQSMGFSSLAYTKADYARTTAATFAHFLSTQRDAVGLVTFTDVVAGYLPARYRPGHLQRLIAALERATAGTKTDIVSALQQIARTVRKRGLLVIISDVLTDVAELGTQLQYLRSQGHEIVMLRILDPAEVIFPFTDAATFVDAETGRDVFIDPAAARAQYQSSFQRHAEELSTTCARLGVDVRTILTSQPLELALYDFVQSRASAGRQVQRAAGASGGVA